MWGFSLCLMLAEPSHTPVIELFDPLGKDSSPIGARDVKRGSPPHIVFVPLWALGMLNLVVLNAPFGPFQGLDLDVEPHLLAVVGLLVLSHGTDSSAQYSPKCDDVEIGNISEKDIQ